MIREKIAKIAAAVNDLTAKSQEEVEALRIQYLSKKGQISELFDDFRNVPKEDKREIGQLLNQLRDAAQNKLVELKAIIDTTQSTADKHDLPRILEAVTASSQ